MAFGLGRLGLAPDVFWAMTPREIAAAMRADFVTGGAHEPPSRADLLALARAYPDGDRHDR